MPCALHVCVINLFCCTHILIKQLLLVCPVYARCFPQILQGHCNRGGCVYVLDSAALTHSWYVVGLCSVKAFFLPDHGCP